jgi:hypothetical protein
MTIRFIKIFRRNLRHTIKKQRRQGDNERERKFVFQVFFTLNLCRVENVMEFVCFIKSFNYFVTRLPRHLFLEPFDVEAISEPIEFVNSQTKFIAAMQNKKLSDLEDFTVTATGRPPGDKQPPVEVPLCEAEPDVYPCMLAMCGSSTAYFKVSVDY